MGADGDMRPPFARWGLVTGILLFVLTALSRLPFRSLILYSWDSVNYAFGMRHFDVLAEQPQPPGYIAYVWLARLLDAIIHNANTSLVAISVAAGGLAVVALYLLGGRLYGRPAGLAAAVLLATSPLFWLYGEVALPHTLDTALVLSALWLLYRVRRGEQRLVWPAAAILALAGGVRPQTLVFLLPVALYAAWRSGWRRLLGAAALCAALCLLWLVPLLAGAGGLRPYLHKLSAYSQRFEASTSVFRGAGLAGLAHNVGKIVTYTLVASGAALLLLMLWLIVRGVPGWRARRRGADAAGSAAVNSGGMARDAAGSMARDAAGDGSPRAGEGRERTIFLALWVVPTLFYYALIHMGQQGMILVFLPLVFLLAGVAACRLARGRRLWLLVGAVACVNAGAFLLTPADLPGLSGRHLPLLQTIRQNDRYFEWRFATLRRDEPPASTAIIAANWRHVEYYLPQYELLKLGAEDDAVGAGQPSGWPSWALSPNVTGRASAPPAQTLVLFDGDESALFDDLPGVTTTSRPGIGSMRYYEWPPGTGLVLSGGHLQAVPAGRILGPPQQ